MNTEKKYFNWFPIPLHKLKKLQILGKTFDHHFQVTLEDITRLNTINHLLHTHDHVCIYICTVT
jgi:hypothetical protein